MSKKMHDLLFAIVITAALFALVGSVVMLAYVLSSTAKADVSNCANHSGEPAQVQALISRGADVNKADPD